MKLCIRCQTPIDKANPNWRKMKYCSLPCFKETLRGTPSDFWAKVDKRGPDECWPWTASTYKKKGKQMGYGRHAGSGPYTYAHRCAWIFTHGEIPAGLLVMHKCDNVICCNPAHLELGTDKQNNDDKMLKGRNHTKLTPEQVLEILAAFAGIPKGGGHGMNLQLAAKYGVSDKTISVIRNGHKWKHLKAEASDIGGSPDGNR